MLVSERHKLLYVHNPKTAGSSISNWLVKNTMAYRAAYTHATAAEGRVSREQWAGYFKFGFVRNPWARQVSWWRMIAEHPDREKDNVFWAYVRLNGRTFEEFVHRCTLELPSTNGKSSNSFVRPQFDYFTDSSGKVLVDFIGRYEHLERDWKEVIARGHFNRWRRAQPPLPELNRAKTEKDYRSFYTPELRDIVAARSAVDIDCFGYDF